MIYIPSKETFERMFFVYDSEHNLIGKVYNECQIYYLQIQCRFLKCELLLVDTDGNEFLIHTDGYFRNVPEIFNYDFMFVLGGVSLKFLTENTLETIKQIDDLVGKEYLYPMAKELFERTAGVKDE